MTNAGEYLTVEDASKFCAERGAPYAVSTLNRFRSSGGGPRFVKMGARRVAYPRQGLVDWLSAKLGPEVASTSEYRAA
jgi:hypothetical protein